MQIKKVIIQTKHHQTSHLSNRQVSKRSRGLSGNMTEVEVYSLSQKNVNTLLINKFFFLNTEKFTINSCIIPNKLHDNLHKIESVFYTLLLK